MMGTSIYDFMKKIIKRHHEKLNKFSSLPQVATDGRIRALSSMENEIV